MKKGGLSTARTLGRDLQRIHHRGTSRPGLRPKSCKDSWQRSPTISTTASSSGYTRLKWARACWSSPTATANNRRVRKTPLVSFGVIRTTRPGAACASSVMRDRWHGLRAPATGAATDNADTDVAEEYQPCLAVGIVLAAAAGESGHAAIKAAHDPAGKLSIARGSDRRASTASRG